MKGKWFQKLCTIFRKHLLIILIIFGIIVISVIISDFYFEWITLFGHTEQYPQKVAAIAMLITALFTLILALATFNATKQSNLREETRRKDEIRKEERDRKEKVLKEIVEWSANVLKHCSSVATGFNNELERSKARDEYLTLKFAGENFVASIENETSFSDLLALLCFANNCFDGPSFNSLQDDKEKRANLETFCKNARTEAFKLLRKTVTNYC